MNLPAQDPAEIDGPSIFGSAEPFPLECGESLPTLRVAYETWGELNARRNNAVLVVHALTGDSHAASGGSSGDPRPGWWEGLIGEGRALDPATHFIVCPNLLGSCYGSSGPGPGEAFPTVTTRDMVRAQRLLLEGLGIERLELVIGGSLGGMVAWEWAVTFPGFARAVVPIAGSPQGSPWLIALNQVARQAILDDPGWLGGRYRGRGPARGLALARMIAMISYRTPALFEDRFGRGLDGPQPDREWDPSCRFGIESYLLHQGRKLVERFDARAYVALTRAMDLHDVARGRGSLREALGLIRSDLLALGIDSDLLYWPAELRSAVEALRESGGRAAYDQITSAYGHDAFLVEHGQLNEKVGAFLEGRRPCG